jgi:hypothetical protein
MTTLQPLPPQTIRSNSNPQGFEVRRQEARASRPVQNDNPFRKRGSGTAHSPQKPVAPKNSIRQQATNLLEIIPETVLNKLPEGTDAIQEAINALPTAKKLQFATDLAHAGETGFDNVTAKNVDSTFAKSSIAEELSFGSDIGHTMLAKNPDVANQSYEDFSRAAQKEISRATAA